MTKLPQAASRSRQGDYVLRVYVSRSTVRSALAVRNIRRVCKVHCVPTLIKRPPSPLQRLVGDMSDLNNVLLGLDLRGRD